MLKTLSTNWVQLVGFYTLSTGRLDLPYNRVVFLHILPPAPYSFSQNYPQSTFVIFNLLINYLYTLTTTPTNTNKLIKEY